MTNKRIRCLFMYGVATLVLSIPWPSFSADIANEECMQCHSDESLSRTKSEGIKEKVYVDQNSFNYSMHNINGIKCVDCHEDITALNFDAELPHSPVLAPVNCANCHADEDEAYQGSVHRKAKGKGVSIPCFSCHEYHYVTRLDSSSVFERENRFCLKCHNPNNSHDWLPQKETHFAYVECAVCHAPSTARRINLRFFDFIQQKFLNADEILPALKTDVKGFMPLVDTDKDGIISPVEFDNMVLLFRQANLRGTFHAELVVEMSPKVHSVNKGGAQGDCKLCHEPSSPFFQDITFYLRTKDDRLVPNQVERKVLETYHVTHFYALGGTRVRLLDKIGAGIFAGGLGIIAAHLIVRITTIPLRRRRKEQEQQHH